MNHITNSDEIGILEIARQQIAVADAQFQPIDAFAKALAELVHYAAEDALRSAWAAHGPDLDGIDQRAADVFEAARKAFGPPLPAPAPIVDSGLLTLHNPDARFVVWGGE